ncbi:hypothetical protein [Paeniglutamicibacter antarcticus]|uniref:Uncharacterized protein n=1 Tax=Paeniglutamicibacter antarcticus TaxID=494023 RepID=A0ABP9TQ67_9MICC
MNADSVIVLDPINRNAVDASLAAVTLYIPVGRISKLEMRRMLAIAQGRL